MNRLIYNRPIVFLIGAGASVPLGKKATVEFLEWLKLPQQGVDYRLLSSICAQIELTEELGIKHDVEVVLDHLESLIAAGELLERSGDASLVKRLEKTSRGQTGPPLNPYGSPLNIGENIRLREQIRDLIVKHYFEIDSNKAFRLYDPFFGSLSYEGLAMPVFTTNYDLAIEKVHEHPETQFRLVDGFTRETGIPEWRRSAYEGFTAFSITGRIGGVVLFKLHGSVDWVRTPSGAIQRVTSHEKDPGQMQTVLIYPSRLKGELYDEPFRTNYAYLRACLLNAKVCVIIGFSFRDQEIVEELHQAIGLNDKLKLVIIDPNAQAIKSRLQSRFGFEPRAELIQEGLNEENASSIRKKLAEVITERRKSFFFFGRSAK